MKKKINSSYTDPLSYRTDTKDQQEKPSRYQYCPSSELTRQEVTRAKIKTTLIINSDKQNQTKDRSNDNTRKITNSRFNTNHKFSLPLNYLNNQ